MQVPVQGETTAVLDELVQASLPGGRGFGAWRAFLRAHASIMRELAGELATSTGLTLGDFDVLAQLAGAGGELRMTDLAARALSSRSAMTRRIDRLVDEGLVGRGSSDADGRGVVVELTEAGLGKLGDHRAGPSARRRAPFRRQARAGRTGDLAAPARTARVRLLVWMTEGSGACAVRSRPARPSRDVARVVCVS